VWVILDMFCEFSCWYWTTYWRNLFHSLSASFVMIFILFSIQFQRVVLWKGQHLACHPLVGLTQSVENKMELAHVLASQITWVTHMRLVVQNVFWTQTVPLIVPAYATSVKILVLEHVARMQTAKWWITYHLALAIQGILEIHSDTAAFYHLNVRWKIILYTLKLIFYIMFV